MGGVLKFLFLLELLDEVIGITHRLPILFISVAVIRTTILAMVHDELIVVLLRTT